jgi:hypothetical protein
VFAPATITNPDRILFGLPTNFVAPSGPLYTTSDVKLSLGFSSSSPVDLVESVELDKDRYPGSQGFYFRSQLESDYYYMIGYVNGKKTLYFFSVPSGTDLKQITLSDVPGVVIKFAFFEYGATIPSGNLNTYVDPGQIPDRPSSRFRCTFSQTELGQIGRAQPVPLTGASVTVGQAMVYPGGFVQYIPLIEEVVFTAFS